MLTKKVALVCLVACLGMGRASCVELIDTGGRGMAAVAAVGLSGAPASDGAGGSYAGSAHATPWRPAVGAESAPVTPVPVPNPYCLLLIGLGMLGFTSRRQSNEVFARNP